MQNTKQNSHLVSTHNNLCAQRSAVSKMEKSEKFRSHEIYKIKVNILTNSNLNLKQYPMHIDTQDSAKYW